MENLADGSSVNRIDMELLLGESQKPVILLIQNIIWSVFKIFPPNDKCIQN